MVEISTNGAAKKRRPACSQCSGTGYVYLWSVARGGELTWYCDRCKRSWADAGTEFGRVFAASVAVEAAVPVAAAVK
jgi:hypothetical protein